MLKYGTITVIFKKLDYWKVNLFQTIILLIMQIFN